MKRASPLLTFWDFSKFNQKVCASVGRIRRLLWDKHESENPGRSVLCFWGGWSGKNEPQFFLAHGKRSILPERW